MAGDPAADTPPGLSLCPSAPHDWDEARLIGVVGGTAIEPEISFVDPRPVTDELLALAGSVAPGEVFRFSALCRETGCSQFRNGRCGIAAAVVEAITPAKGRALPVCAIRPQCRWWREHAADACRRCRFIVTDDAAQPTSLTLALARQAGAIPPAAS